MPIKKTLSLALGLACLAGSAGAAPSERCPILEARNWTATIDRGFDQDDELLISGEILAPTPGYEVTFRPTIAAKTYPPILFLELIAVPPSGAAIQVLTWTDVFYAGPADASAYRSIKIMCAGRDLGAITRFSPRRDDFPSPADRSQD